MNNDKYNTSALSALKDNVLLLTMANDHLGDEKFLIKIGNNISQAVEFLNRDISSLKKEYPGKFMNDVDTDSILQKIDNAAQRMLRPDKETMENHSSGTLGREMESYVISIKKAINLIRSKVQGTDFDKAGKKGYGRDILMPIKGMFHYAGNVIIFSVKILACIMVLAASIFSYLFFTMEKETPFLNEIQASQALIQQKKQLIPDLEHQRQDLNDKRNKMKIDSLMTRDEKVAALDVEMKIKKIDTTLNQIAIEITVHEKKITDNQEKLDALRKKSFIQRLLKQ